MLLSPQDCEPRRNNHEVLDPSPQPDVGLSLSVQGGQGFAQAGERAQELSSAEHHDGADSSRVHEGEAARFLLRCSSQLNPLLCIEALESCRFSSLLVLKELQRGSCDSLFQLYFYWKLENIIHCHPSHLPAACLHCSLQTDPNQTSTGRGRQEGGSEEHQLREVPRTFGATRPADSLLGFLP